MRRAVIKWLFGLPVLGLAVTSAQASQASRKNRILIKSAWGSADPTQATFAFHHANAFAAEGHEVQIFLLGEGVTLMRSAVANAVIPVGWAPLSEALPQTIAHKTPIHV